jgi:hypothetical protein
MIANVRTCSCKVSVILVILCLFVQLRTSALRLIVRSSLDVPTIATRRLHACHHAGAPSGGRWNYGREMSGNFAEMTISTPFRDLLHAAATTWDRRLYFPFEGRRAEHFFALKIRRLRPGVNPRTWVPKASTLPLDHRSRFVIL